jgi:hypothetical protein
VFATEPRTLTQHDARQLGPAVLLIDECKSDAERLAAHAESVSSAAGVGVGDLGDARWLVTSSDRAASRGFAVDDLDNRRR